MSILRIKELEAQLERRDSHIAVLEAKTAAYPALLDSLTYLRNCIEDGMQPAMREVNDAIRQATGGAQ